MIRQVALLAGSFLGVTLLAALLGAANTGTAATFGAIAFAAALMWILLREP